MRQNTTVSFGFEKYVNDREWIKINPKIFHLSPAEHIKLLSKTSIYFLDEAKSYRIHRLLLDVPRAKYDSELAF